MLALLCSGVGLATAQVTGPKLEVDRETDRTNAAVERSDVEVPPPAFRFDVVTGDTDHRIGRLLEQMTLDEKIGQLVQVYPEDDKLSEELTARIRNGEIGSIFYPGDAEVVRKAQRIALVDSRLGIPLIVARDVVHGFRTVFPIPLGQAASWNPELVERAAGISAEEARSEGVGWTFAPMIDICRDPRWGRIAETFGEDTKLTSDLAAAMVRGFQLEDNGKIHGLAACAKHYVAYGLAEGGRDYNRASVGRADLQNIYLPPFKSSVDAGCRTIMTTFSEVNGVPGTAHQRLINGVLKGDWRFRGMVVSDWGSITEMIAHGYCKDEEEAAKLAMLAGVDMDMCSPAFADHLAELVKQGIVPEARVDDAVRRVLRLKVDVAPRCESDEAVKLLSPKYKEAARELARQSVVLLKNDGVLPLDANKLGKIAVIGPMADAPQQQLGCWALDGEEGDSVTPLAELRERLTGQAELLYARGANGTFGDDSSGIEEAVRIAEQADVVLLFVGEDALLSGEARSRADICVPGVQSALIEAIAKTGKPTALVFLAGRPLAIEEEMELANAVLFAWHPGTMAGPAIGDLLFGDASPSGKLPVTFPKSVGQVPLYYNHSNTGRPSPKNYKPLVGSSEEDLPEEFQYKSHYLDADPFPLFPFGFGLSYTTFEYSDISVGNSSSMRIGDTLTIGVTLTNMGDVLAAEVVQLYVRDHTARIVRPIRELKSYRRVRLRPGESKRVEFQLSAEDLAFKNGAGEQIIEPGDFSAWIGGDSATELGVEFRLLPRQHSVPLGSAP
ncbi:MAG: beta-glucosidase BglX [Aeoliella sp.]